MKKFTFLFFILIIGFAFAQPLDTSYEEIMASKENSITSYNENIDQVPNVIKNRFKNEVVYLEVERNSGDLEAHYIIIKDTYLEEITEESDKKITLRLSFSEDRFNELINSGDITLDFKTALKEKELEIKAVTFSNKIKVAILRFILFFVK